MRIFRRKTVATKFGIEAENQKFLFGQIAARQVAQVDSVKSLADVEFSVFSQWGEDGILEWLIFKLGCIPPNFIEFGVENYRESNTRFLLKNRNWRGLVLDGSKEMVATITNDSISWRHDLTAVAAFITRSNIEDLIASAGFSGEIGVLSIDIDGNDYWVWDAIKNVSPHIVVVEYNSNFGDMLPLTIPYRDDFVRTLAHFSNLYYGASYKALEVLGKSKGYVLLGSNRTGSNLFFVREDRAGEIIDTIGETKAFPCHVREARNKQGSLTLLGGFGRTELIGSCEVVNVLTGDTGALSDFGPLFSDGWKRAFGVEV
ncbi:hypothetical protein C1J05_06610 [Sulfitobacter sp. JL08]|uniref:hypothetical protein n=1 Tax=Sulfitobacter sp. JL08 TaxID=2070369 RepID=UPI000E0BF8FD|nr:hypothetical protein [Sulfitobacter sp. JL08]AXI54203.1 hypothetical protein C1J05_06610 [Sulfitobacter sp. JL08]